MQRDTILCNGCCITFYVQGVDGMTVTEMAKQLNTTPMTVYRRLKKTGVNIADLRDSVSGELTSSGVAAIAALFDTSTAQSATDTITDDVTRTSQGSNSDTQQAQTAADAIRIAELVSTVEGQRQLIHQLEAERDSLRQQLSAVTSALMAEQADRQHERQLLTGSESPRRRWWQIWR